MKETKNIPAKDAPGFQIIEDLTKEEKEELLQMWREWSKNFF